MFTILVREIIVAIITNYPLTYGLTQICFFLTHVIGQVTLLHTVIQGSGLLLFCNAHFQSAVNVEREDK